MSDQEVIKGTTISTENTDSLAKMFCEAHWLYNQEVATKKMTYSRYVEDFLNTHYYCDAIDAYSKNQHRKNYCIAKGLLHHRKDLVDAFFIKRNFGKTECEQLISLYNRNASIEQIDTGSILPNTRESTVKPHNNTRISFEHCINPDLFNLIVKCANEVKLFKEEISCSTFEGLLTGDLDIVLHSRNNRLLAEFFDILAKKGYIASNWQTTIERQGSIKSSRGKRDKTLTAHQISSALYYVREHAPNPVHRRMATQLDGLPNLT